MLPRIWRNMLRFIYLCSCVELCRLRVRGEGKTKLTLAGFVPVDIKSGWSSGGIIPAIEMALDDINDISDLLHGYELTWEWKDDKCNPGLASYQLCQHVYNGTQKIMVLGGGCSLSTVYVASYSQYFNLIQVSYSAASPELSDKAKYPLFFRTQQSDLTQNTARIAVMKHFNWKRVAALYQNEKFFVQVIDELIERMRSDDISLLVSLPLNYQPSEDLIIIKVIDHFLSMLEGADVDLVSSLMFRSECEPELQIVKENDGRIIVVHAYEDHARALFCTAYGLGMYGADYVWMIPGWYSTDWWKADDERINCTQKEMKTVLESVITTVQVGRDKSSNRTTINGETFSQYEKRYLYRLQNQPEYANLEYHTWHGLGYDAIWAIALTLNSSIEEVGQLTVTEANGSVRPKRLEDFNYQDHEMAQIFKKTFANVSFHGVSGRVWFNSNGDRLGMMALYQMRDGREHFLGECDPEGNLILYHPFEWQGDNPPFDGQQLEYKILTVSDKLFIVSVVLSAVGIAITATFLAFNVAFRNHGFVKLSSPRMNNIMLVGAFLVYLSIIPFGLVGCSYLGDKLVMRTVCCVIATWLMSVGFSLSFGSMFAKTWRVHRIFTKLMPRTAPIQDPYLVVIVVSLALMDVIFLTTWQLLYPWETFLKTVSVEVEGMKTKTVIQSYECTSAFMWVWTGALYAQKGLVLLFGCFLAYETRNIRVEGLNDSRQISMSIYNILMASIIGITLNLVLDDKPTFSYTFQSLLIFLCCTTTLAMLFLPKVSTVVKDPSGAEYLRRRTREGLTVSSTMEDFKRNELMVSSGSSATLHTNME